MNKSNIIPPETGSETDDQQQQQQQEEDVSIRAQLDLEASPVASEEEPQDDLPPTDDATREQQQRNNSCYKRLFLAVILVGFIAFVIADSLTNGYVRTGLTAFLEWIEEHPIEGLFAFALVYFVATIFFIPGSILTLDAGFVFANAFGLGVGVALGTLSVFVGASAGAIASFLLGRYMLRDWVQGYVVSKKCAIFQALDVAFAEKGFRIMALLRLSPIIPFNAINYVAGVTALGFWQYTLALVAILPGTILYVFLGASAGSLADSANSGDNMTVTIVVIVVGVVFGVMAVALTSYYAKVELNKIVAQRRAEQEEDKERDEDVGEVDPEERLESSPATVAE